MSRTWAGPLRVAVTALVLGASLGAQSPATPAGEVLIAATPIERALAPDATLRVTVSLDAGAFADVTVEQLGIDVIVAAIGPDGAAIDEVDDASEVDGPEHVRFVAGAAGDYVLVVRSEPLAGVRPGRCRLTLSPPRPAGGADQAHAAERRAANERAAALQARYDEFRKAGKFSPADVMALVDTLGTLASAADAAGRLRQADRARSTLAFLLLTLDRASEVVALDERRLLRLTGARDALVRATALTQLAEASSRLGETTRAIALFEEALTIPQPPGAEAITRDNLGGTLRRVGRLQEALDAHQGALEYFRKAGPRRSVAVVLTRQALAWVQLGDLPRALALHKEALAITVEIGDRLMEARSLANVAGIERDLGDVAAARVSADRSLAAAIAIKSPLHEGHASLVLANLDVRERRFADAVPRAARAATIYESAEYPDGVGQAKTALANAQLALGRLDEADEAAQAGATIAHDIGNLANEGDALYTGAQVAIARGRLAEARTRLEKALACVEQVRASLAGTQLRASLTSYNHDVYELHVDVLMALHEEQPSNGFERLAFESSELSRARSLLDVLATSAVDVRAGVDPALLDRERALRGRIDDKDVALRRARDAGNDAAAATLTAEIDELARALQVAESQVVAHGPGYAALMRPQAVSVDALRRDVIDADTVLLEYAIGESRGWLFALTSTGLESFEVAGRTTLEPSVRAALSAMTARQARDPRLTAAAWRTAVAAQDASLGQALDALGRQLLGPVASRLHGDWRGKRLVVVGSAPLEYVPFAALPVPQVDGMTGAPELLIAGHEVVAAPSAAAIAAVRRETAGRAPAPKTLAVIADPVFEAGDPRVRTAPALTRAVAPPVQIAVRGPGATRDGLARLPFSRREAAAITALVPASARVSVTDFTASRAWVLAAPLGDYRILHFATHGLIDTAQPALSSLALSLVDERGAPVDGYLRMHDIYNRRLPVDLVVLSACRTALGQDVRGEGLVGLTRGFLYAGARSVVASLWQVDDVATAELMTRVYRHLLTERQPPAAALRAAQRDLARDPRWTAPYFWAGFVIQGDWR
ncbi:MAG: CHAT domain-containing protein [Vicinamibacteraceae bacterium]